MARSVWWLTYTTTPVDRRVPGEQENAVEAQGLRTYLAESLPEYMVPAAYVWLESLPLSANGKLDRKLLPDPEGAVFIRRDYEEPQGDIEIALAAIWSKVLQVDRVGRHDNFFELGGHSLLAIKVMEQARRDSLQVDVRSLFATPTLAEVAATVGSHAGIVEVPPNLLLALDVPGEQSPETIELRI